MNSIRKLDDHESRAIRASARFASLHSIVYELVLNSLDANATTIDIGIDKNSLEIVVRDDGEFLFLIVLVI